MTNKESMRTVVLGKGFLGRAFAKRGFEVWDRTQFDATRESPYDLGFIFQGVDVIVNCIAVSDTRYCENPKNFDEVMRVNAELPRRLSDFCAQRDKCFVHISTGCLYGDATRPCAEDAALKPSCAYAVSKYVGERYCRPDRDLILRPRLLFGGDDSPLNLLSKMLRFEKFLDEFNSVTSTDTVVDVVSLLAARETGVFNVANDGIHTLYEMAGMLGLLRSEKLTREDVWKMQGVHVVNNVMDISKLKNHYKPNSVTVEMSKALRCLRNKE